MIGWLRLFLSLVVMESHLSVHFGLGRQAVAIFYWLSGVVIIAAFYQSYQGQSRRFLFNRALRIFPSYWVCFLGFLVVFYVVGSSIYGMGIPSAPVRFLEFIGIVRHISASGSVSVIPQSFAVTGELVCYLLVAFGAFSSGARSLIVATVAMMLGNWIYAGADWQDFYFSPLGAIAFFSLGGMAYWLGLRLPKGSNLAGEMSYPLFLTHYGVGSTLSILLGITSGWPLFVAALPPTLAISWLLVVAVERPVQKFRSSLRGKTNVWSI